MKKFGVVMQLRSYQKEAKDKILFEYSNGINRQLVMLPTGCGKTPLFLSVLRDLNGPSIVIAPNDQICSQIKKEAKFWFPECRPCFLKEDSLENCNLFISTNMMAFRDKRLDSLRNFKIKNMVIDEAHHSPAITDNESEEKTGTYRKIIKEIKPDFILGVTATPCRLDGLGMNEIFQTLVYQKTIPEMVENGYLCPLKCFEIYTKININSIFCDTEMERHSKHKNILDSDEQEESIKKNKAVFSILQTDQRDSLIVDSYKEKASDRKHTIAFCLSCEHAEELAQKFNENGIVSEAITHKIKHKERKEILTKFFNGETKVITNFNVLTEGFDFPALDCILMTRPMKSHALYTQCVGRGTRIFPGKQDCLILDFRDDCSAQIVCFASMDTRDIGENPYEDLDKDHEKELEIVPIYESDGSLVFKEKEISNFSDRWKERPVTEAQREILLKNNVDLNFDMLSRGEAYEIISNLIISEKQAKFLYGAIKRKEFDLNISYDEITRLSKSEFIKITRGNRNEQY